MTNNRFVNNTFSELQKVNHNPVFFDYKDLSVFTLEEAVQKIIPLIPRSVDYVAIAKKNCNQNSPLLTPDESAAIYLYTMQIPLFSCLNGILRAEDRQTLESWFAFLKLFITGLEKLPAVKGVIWRGVNYDDTLSFVDDDVHVWWSINSCSMNLNVVQLFLGENGTLFAIDTVHGKDISIFSAVPDEQEVVLMPGTRVRRRYESLSFIDRLFIVHLEEITPQNQLQSESNHLFQMVKQKYQQNSRIQRIMNPAKSIPIQQSYINLSIVRDKEQHQKEMQLRHTQHADDIISAFEEIYGTKIAIDIKDIFNSCKTQEKQVLVFGRAGIGKSTFCRYITYQWATGSLWPQYELLVFIPLRRLTTYRYSPLPPGQNYSLIDLLKKEIFNSDLSAKDDILLEKQFDAGKMLWILDGYDEIVGNVPLHLEYLFEQLLNTPHHILTSRPYMNTLSYDIKMEIIGFTDKNIEEYTRQFFEQMKDELDDASIKSEKLLKFLKSSSSIWGVAHIPINLELICSCWSNEDWSETQLKITTLYSMMTEWLCRRYLSAGNIQMQNISKRELYGRCEKELGFLESLAFNAMEQNTIIIRPTLLEKALDEAKISLKNHQNVLNIGILKSFHKQGTGTQIESNKDHYFVHLSFQEYFAARYLIKTLNASSNAKTSEFIQHKKYNQRYALLFIFASGLLNENDVKPCLNIFWDAILAEPLDLIGVRHIQLVISCMEETTGASTIPWYTQLLEWIAKCIKYSIITKNGIICRRLSQSLRRAQSISCNEIIINTFIDLLQYDDADTRIRALSLITAVNISNPPSALISSVIITLGNENRDVRVEACGALEKIGEKTATNEVISKLLSALEDENGSVRQRVCEALGRMHEKAATNEVISKLVMSILGDENKDVRLYALSALAKMGVKAGTDEVINKLLSALRCENKDVRNDARSALIIIAGNAGTNEVISKLVSALGDENENVRWNVRVALGKMGEKAVTNEVISKLISTLGDENVAVRWSDCPALWNTGERAATNEIIRKLVGALKDENTHVREYACEALGNADAKTATNEVISKLANALQDEDRSVRGRACETLGKIGEKAATNEVIRKLVNALGDESRYVRRRACEALQRIGEKAPCQENRPDFGD